MGGACGTATSSSCMLQRSAPEAGLTTTQELALASRHPRRVPRAWTGLGTGRRSVLRSRGRSRGRAPGESAPGGNADRAQSSRRDSCKVPVIYSNNATHSRSCYVCDTHSNYVFLDYRIPTVPPEKLIKRSAEGTKHGRPRAAPRDEAKPKHAELPLFRYTFASLQRQCSGRWSMVRRCDAMPGMTWESTCFSHGVCACGSYFLRACVRVPMP